MNSREKNTIIVDLSDDEKIVFSQLGINPLIKLGKEYLTSNNFVRLKENINKKASSTQSRKISKSKEEAKNEINIKATSISKDKSKKKNDQNEKEENVFLEKKAEGELIDEINNARKKRRRSSASIE